MEQFNVLIKKLFTLVNLFLSILLILISLGNFKGVIRFGHGLGDLIYSIGIIVIIFFFLFLSKTKKNKIIFNILYFLFLSF